MGRVDRYVVVSKEAKLIIGGPYLWDGQTTWQPLEDGTLMLEADALAQGYRAPQLEQTVPVVEPAPPAPEAAPPIPKPEQPQSTTQTPDAPATIPPKNDF